MKNLRIEAIAKGKPTYSSGKPCRAGHMSERYTSNGTCIVCAKQQTEARRDAVATARGKKYLAMAAGFTPHTVLSSQRDREMFNELSDVMQFTNSDVTAQVHKFVHALYVNSATPRALTRDDLLSFMTYTDGKVTNYEQLNIEETEDTVYVQHNGVRYNAEQCMDVLRGKALNVKPTTTL
jgi:hypothetical protein